MSQISSGYTRPIIGFNQWPHTTFHYHFEQTHDSLSAVLALQLIFSAQRSSNEKLSLVLQREINFFREIQSQLQQPTTKVYLKTTLVSLADESTMLMATLLDYVNEVILNLEQQLELSMGEATPIVVISKFPIKEIRVRPEPVFPLEIEIGIKRVRIDEQDDVKSDQKEIEIEVFEMAVLPLLDQEDHDLDEFTDKFELAFPEFKLGISKPKSDLESKKLFAFSLKHFSFKLSAKNLPNYAGIAPLSKPLINQTVALPNYSSGIFLGDAEKTSRAFSQIDLEPMFEVFADTLDRFLGIKNLELINAITQSSDTFSIPTAVEKIQTAKAQIAAAVSKNSLTPIENKVEHPHVEILEKETTIQLEEILGIANKAVVICLELNVLTTSENPPIDLYGKLINTLIDGDPEDQTMTRVKLAASKPDTNQETIMVTWIPIADLESVKKQSTSWNLRVESIELDPKEAMGRQTSSNRLWLVNPILFPIPDLSIAIAFPKKTFPNTPVLLEQKALPTVDSDEHLDGKSRLLAAMAWKYDFTYNYSSEPEDILKFSISDDKQSQSLNESTYTSSALFEALIIYYFLYADLLKEIEEKGTNCLVALRSYVWLVEQIANACKVISQQNHSEENGFDFEIREHADKENGQLLITITSKSPTNGISLPSIQIDGLTTKCVEVKDAEVTYQFFEGKEPNSNPVPATSSKDYVERHIQTVVENVLVTESAKASIFVSRNEIIEAVPINERFNRISNSSTFPNTCRPKLSYTNEINIADLRPNLEAQTRFKMQAYLEWFLQTFFTSAEKSSIIVQIQVDFSMPLNNIQGQPRVKLPIAMISTTEIQLPNLSTFTQSLAATIENWMQSYHQEYLTGGQINLNISLYGIKDIRHCLLNLTQCYLSVDAVKLN